MTTFYRFANRAEFISAGGINQSEYTKDGIGFSVIGEQYESTEEFGEDAPLIVREFWVNTTEPVDGWDAYLVHPVTPARIFA